MIFALSENRRLPVRYAQGSQEIKKVGDIVDRDWEQETRDACLKVQGCKESDIYSQLESLSEGSSLRKLLGRKFLEKERL